MVRAKFKVSSIKLLNAWDGNKQVIGKEISLYPVSAREGENSVFGKATPTGGITMVIIPEDASSQFEMNKEYYVDFTDADQ